jgi:hypothetical protein
MPVYVCDKIGQEARTLGIIDTLTSGFDVVNRRLWIILVPLLTDLVLWLGLQIKAEPIEALLWSVTALGEARGLAGLLDGLNLAVVITLYLPTLAAVGGELGSSGMKPLITVLPRNLLDTALMSTGLLLGALIIGTFYMSAVGQGVRGELADVKALVRHMPRLGLRLLILSCVYGVVLGTSGLLVVLSGIWLAPLSAAASTVCVMVVQATMLWALFVLYFSPSAIFVSRLKPLEAVRWSYQVVRGSFWSALGFVALVTVISVGIPLALSYIMSSAIGTAVAIVGNAYIGSGLVAASMVFYREKVKSLDAAGVRAWRRSDRV